MKTHLLIIGVLIAIALPLFLLTPQARELWLPDEPRYAEIAEEMAASGNWLIPHLHGEIYTEKPPLYFWLLAGSAKLFGSWQPFAMIFPSALSALGVIIVVYGFVALFFNRRVGVLSSLILMTSVLFIGVGQFVRMDMFLLLCLSLSLFSFARLYFRATPHDNIYATVFFFAAALATLAKGPVGLGLPGLIILIFLVWRRDFGVLKKMHLFWGGLLYSFIVLAWFVPAIMKEGWDYAYLITIKQNLGRVHDSFSHARPWYFYLHTLPWITFPWFPFFISAIISLRKTPAASTDRDVLRFLWAWFGATFLFFSAVSGKLELYLLPLFPPMAILTAYFWDAFITRRESASSMSLTIPAYVLAGSLLIFSIALILRGESFTHWGGIFCVDVVGSLLIYAAIRQSPRLLFGIISSITPLILSYGALNIVPTLDPQLSLKAVLQDMKSISNHKNTLALWESYYPIQYYVEPYVPVLKTSQEKQAFFSSPTPVYCLAREKNLERIQQEVGKPLYVVGTYRIQHKNFLLLSQFSQQSLVSKKGY